MLLNKNVLIFFLTLGCAAQFLCVLPSYAKEDNRLELSGFARMVMGFLDEKHASYLGYENHLSLSQQSLLGLQADYQIAENWSVTGQFVGHTGKERDSGIEWLYVTYQPSRSMQIKLGKQRTPFFNYSDSIDVGFAYPWITLPQQVYSSVFFSTFDGMLANYAWSGKNFALDVEGYWGNFDGDIYTAGVEVKANIDNLHGLIASLNYESWTFRTAYHTTQAEVELDELNEFSLLLRQFGFTQSANSLDPDGEIEFYQIAANYENIDFFFRSEATNIRAKSSTIPNIDSYLVSAGYYYYPFVSYISFAKSHSEYGQPVDEIPFGVSPQLDALAYGYQNIFGLLPFDSSQSITLGTRWDWKANLALKAEITWIEAKAGSSANFLVLDQQAFDRKAPLYQIALEWVF